MANVENEITFGQLLSVFKKSLKKAIIYILVAVIAVTAGLILIKGLTDVKVYTTTISFAEASAQTLDSINYNKSNAVGKALIETKKSLDYSAETVKRVSVSAITDEKATEAETILPTSFEISLRTSHKLDFTSNEYRELLDSIARQYVNIFAVSKLTTATQSYNVSSDIGKIEYFQIADKLASLSYSMKNTLSSYFVDFDYSNEFRSSVSNKTFADVITSLELLEDDIESVKHYIVYNKAELTENGVGNYLAVANALLDSKITSNKAQLENAKFLLSTYSPDSSYDADGNLIISSKDSEIVLKLTNNVNLYSSQLARYEEEKSNLTFYSNLYDTTSIPTTDASKQYVEERIKTFASTFASIVEEYQLMAEEYNQSTYLSSTVSITSPAITLTDSFLSDGLVIAVDVLVAVLAYCVAFFKTLSQVKKEEAGKEQEKVVA